MAKSKLIENDVRRLYECLECEYYQVCMTTVPEAEDNPDGSCKTKDEFRQIEREGRMS